MPLLNPVPLTADQKRVLLIAAWLFAGSGLLVLIVGILKQRLLLEVIAPVNLAVALAIYGLYRKGPTRTG